MSAWLVAAYLVAIAPIIGAIIFISRRPATLFPLKANLIVALISEAMVFPLTGHLVAMPLAALMLIALTALGGTTAGTGKSFLADLGDAISFAFTMLVSLVLLQPYTGACFYQAGYRDGCEEARQAIAAGRDYELHSHRPMWCIVSDAFAPNYAHWSGKQAGIRATLPTDEEYFNQALADLHAAGAKIHLDPDSYVSVSFEAAITDQDILKALGPVRGLTELVISDVQGVAVQDVAEALNRSSYLKSIVLVGQAWTEEDAKQLQDSRTDCRVAHASRAPQLYGKLYSPSRSSP